MQIIVCVKAVPDTATRIKVAANGQRIDQEVASDELDTLCKPMLPDIVLEQRLHRWQIEADASQIPVTLGNRHRQTALCGADIGKAVILLPRIFFGERLRNGQGASTHTARKAF